MSCSSLWHDVHSMTEWDGYLFGTGGLFTKQSFHPIESFDQVDLVILSNLQSFHSIGTDHHDWTLRDVYMIPRVNLNTRANVSDIAVGKALGLFPHQLKAFHQFTGSAQGNVTERQIRSFFKIRKLRHSKGSALKIIDDTFRLENCEDVEFAGIGEKSSSGTSGAVRGTECIHIKMPRRSSQMEG